MYVYVSPSCHLSEIYNLRVKVAGALVQYPTNDGRIVDYSRVVEDAKKNNTLMVCATDLLALTMLKVSGRIF